MDEDEFESVTAMLARAQVVMTEMEAREGMEFVSMQTMTVPKGRASRCCVEGKLTNQVSLSGRWRFDTPQKTASFECFQMLRMWFRRQGGIPAPSSPVSVPPIAAALTPAQSSGPAATPSPLSSVSPQPDPTAATASTKILVTALVAQVRELQRGLSEAQDALAAMKQGGARFSPSAASSIEGLASTPVSSSSLPSTQSMPNMVSSSTETSVSAREFERIKQQLLEVQQTQVKLVQLNSKLAEVCATPLLAILCLCDVFSTSGFGCKRFRPNQCL